MEIKFKDKIRFTKDPKKYYKKGELPLENSKIYNKGDVLFDVNDKFSSRIKKISDKIEILKEKETEKINKDNKEEK